MNLKRYIHLYFLLCTFLVTATLLGEGFIAGTLVCTPQGHVAIENLSIGDQVITCDFNNGYVVEPIVDIASYEAADFTRLKIGDATINVASDHKFLLPLKQEWIQASELEEGVCVLGAPLHARYVENVEKVEQKVHVYNLSLTRHHNYLVSERNIIVHNFAEVGCIAFGALEVAKGTTVLNAFLLANPVVAPVVICAGGATLVGCVAWTFWSIFKESRNAAKNDKSNDSNRWSKPQQEAKKPNNNQPPNNTPNKNDNDPISPGSSAIALLKAVEESEEKAAEVFQKTCEYLSTDGGIARVAHAFRADCDHYFGPLLTRMGANINAVGPEEEKKVIEVGTKIIMDISKKLLEMGSKLPVDARGIFENIVIDYSGELITVRGCIHDGIIKTGTMFIQEQHVRLIP